MAIESLKPAMTVSRISRAMDVPRSSIYYRKTGRSGKRKPRVSEIIEAEIIRLSAERTTYGYSRIWALLRNSGIQLSEIPTRQIIFLRCLKQSQSGASRF